MQEEIQQVEVLTDAKLLKFKFEIQIIVVAGPTIKAPRNQTLSGKMLLLNNIVPNLFVRSQDLTCSEQVLYLKQNRTKS